MAAALLSTLPIETAHALSCIKPVTAIGRERVLRISDPDPGTGRRWVATQGAGLFAVARGGAATALDGSAFDFVYEISSAHPRTLNRFIAAREGVHVLVPAEGVFFLGGARVEDIGAATEMTDPDPVTGDRIVLAGRGRVRISSEGDVVRLPGADPVLGVVSWISEPMRSTGARLVAAETGLFRMAATGELTAAPGASREVIGQTYAVTDAEPGSGRRFLASSNGVFAVAADGTVMRLAPEGGGDVGAAVTFSDPDPRTRSRIVAASTGLFALSSDGVLTAIKGGSAKEIGPGRVVRGPDPADGAYLVGAGRGLFRFHPGHGLQPVVGPDGLPVGAVGEISPLARGIRLIGSSGEVFILRADRRLVRVPVSGDDARLSEISEIGDPDATTRERLIGTMYGLFHLDMRPKLVAGLIENEEGRLAFGLSGACLAGASADDFVLLDATGARLPAVLELTKDSRKLNVRLPRSLLPGQAPVVTLAALDGEGAPYRISRRIQVDNPVDWKALVAGASAAILAAHTILFAALTLLAGRSGAAAGMLMHPLSQAVGLWWSWLVRFSPAAQHWLLQRWYHTRKRDIAASGDVLPLSLQDGAGAAISSAQLGGRLGPDRRVWLIGNPGMGKTALARRIEADFFAHPDLRTAMDAYGYIPLLVEARFATDPGPPDRHWLARLAEGGLSRRAFLANENDRDANSSLTEAFLRRSGFVLIIDGANEVSWSDKITKAAAAVPRPGLLVTSQAEPEAGADQYETWRLPETMSLAVRPLLELFLGAEQGRLAFDVLGARPLLGDIRSGYDVRLIESLWKTQPGVLPQDRLGLYEAIVEGLFAGRDPLAPARLSDLAWRLWLDGHRQFTDADLDEAVRQALSNDAGSVTRLIGGDRREFRHDQMRGFLAARHVVETVNPLATLQASEAVWPRLRSEQDLVWGFLAVLVDDQLALRLHRWSLEDPDNRVRLQAALAPRVLRNLDQR